MSTVDEDTASVSPDLGEEEFDSSSVTEAAKQLRVLLVEDDAFMQNLLVSCIKAAAKVLVPHATVSVETSDTAAGALAICSVMREREAAQEDDEAGFDLVLLDYLLPGGCNADDGMPLPALTPLQPRSLRRPLQLSTAFNRLRSHAVSVF